MIRVKGYPYPAFIHIVLDSVLHQVADSGGELDLIHVRFHRTEAVKDQIDLSLVRNGTQPFQDILQELVDIHMLDLKIRSLLIHLHKGKKIGDNAVLSVDLRGNVMHKFLIQFLRHAGLSHQRIRQHLHGSHGGLQLMGHVGDKLRPGLIQNFHSCQHFVERVCDKLCLRIIRNRNRFILVPVCEILNGLGDTGQRFHQHC